MASPDRDKDGNVINRGDAFFNRGGSGASTLAQQSIKNTTQQFAGMVDPRLANAGSVDFAGIQKGFAEWKPTSDWGKMMKGQYMMNTLQGQQDAQAPGQGAGTPEQGNRSPGRQAEQREVHRQGTSRSRREGKREAEGCPGQPAAAQCATGRNRGHVRP